MSKVPKMKTTHENYRPSFSLITGLDPADLKFVDAPNIPLDAILDSTDADFVDVIHTNAAPLISGFGAAEPLGHVDFYVNGGFYQPGCDVSTILSAFRLFGMSVTPFINTGIFGLIT